MDISIYMHEHNKPITFEKVKIMYFDNNGYFDFVDKEGKEHRYLKDEYYGIVSLDD